MARVLLTTAQPGNPADKGWLFGPYELLLASAQLAGGGKHQLTDGPHDADIILFTDSGPDVACRTLRKTALYQRYFWKCFVHAQDDQPLALLPGVYASIEKRWHDPLWTRSGFYVHSAESGRFDFQPFNQDAKWLFSFVGSCSNAPVRGRLADLRHPRFHMEDTSGKIIPAYTSGDAEAIARLNNSYCEIIRESKFVLCPRGVGCSSLRIFEVMAMGRCPVILSDEWVPPDGPQWNLCSLRIPESSVATLPAILGQYEADAGKMGLLARGEWERWFSEKALFETVVDWCLAIRDAGKCGDRWFRAARYLQLLRPFHLRSYLRNLKNAALKK